MTGRGLGFDPKMDDFTNQTTTTMMVVMATLATMKTTMMIYYYYRQMEQNKKKSAINNAMVEDVGMGMRSATHLNAIFEMPCPPNSTS
mmetsp:Transcript_32001/g.89158  ORF Transcript_32001/g.89158 Transcript_32001/m.89158 type:complete len:88 (+) Transcript_32001:139-402(+)